MNNSDPTRRDLLKALRAPGTVCRAYVPSLEAYVKISKATAIMLIEDIEDNADEDSDLGGLAYGATATIDNNIVHLG